MSLGVEKLANPIRSRRYRVPTMVVFASAGERTFARNRAQSWRVRLSQSGSKDRESCLHGRNFVAIVAISFRKRRGISNSPTPGIARAAGMRCRTARWSRHRQRSWLGRARQRERQRLEEEAESRSVPRTRSTQLAASVAGARRNARTVTGASEAPDDCFLCIRYSRLLARNFRADS